MESIYYNFEPQTRGCHNHKVMTSSHKVYEDEFLRIVSASSDELHNFANTLTSDLDLFVEIMRDEVGLNRVMRILGISDHINTILFYPIMIKLPEIMTHERGKDLASRVLDVCHIHEKNMFLQTTYRHGLVLARDVNGCSTLKKAITIADDVFKSDFLKLVAWHAHSLSEDDLGISLIQHVLNLDYTRKTTEDDTRLHELMGEFDEIRPTCDTGELLKLASKLTSDSDLFVEFVKTKRGSLMVQITLGKSEEVDAVLWEAIKRSYTDLETNYLGHLIILRTISVSEKRGNLRVFEQILRLIGYNALYLSKEPNMGNVAVQLAINLHNLDYDDLALMFIVMEIVKCDDEDTLVRLAKDGYGNGVLKKTLQVAKEHMDNLFDDLVDKLKPLLDSLRGSRADNIVALISGQSLDD
ncbi:unnamed protein product [Microthlaspi erraticum]|uniref:PUM-HD domain-containing protein n=1 Tax=Microthlaspi erraticum TaxID=1685480 RepID=A0A6D2J4I4_9BRAS|nr:unnamed protein product [Microthlaspi erraticum]